VRIVRLGLENLLVQLLGHLQAASLVMLNGGSDCLRCTRFIQGHYREICR